LPRLLENIEAELASEKLEASEQRRLHRRAELIPLTARSADDQVVRRDLDHGVQRGSRSSRVGGRGRGATALSPEEQQRDQDGRQATERQPQDLTPRREAGPLLLNEIELLHHLRIGFSRVVSLTKGEAVGFPW
jgi:hypothetical protein